MSLGYVGKCNKIMEDESLVIYSYAGENWNDGGKTESGDIKLQDGVFTIDKMHTIKDISDGIMIGAIKIDRECKNAFLRPGVPCDYIAWCLLVHIIDHYERNGDYPAEEAFSQ